MIQAIAFTLVCYGVTDAPRVDSSTVRLSNGFDQVQGQATTTSRQRTGDRLWVRVDGETVSVRGPLSMQPALSGNGRDGWRDLTDAAVSNEEIRGRLSFNWANRPEVVIDRMTGEVRILQASLLTGRSSFVGDCERAEVETPRF